MDMIRNMMNSFFENVNRNLDTQLEKSYEHTFPRAASEWKTKQENLTRSCRIIAALAALNICVDIASICFNKRARITQIISIHILADVLAMCPPFHRLMKSPAAIPFYFTDAELSSAEKETFLEAKKNSRDRLLEVGKSSLTYRVIQPIYNYFSPMF